MMLPTFDVSTTIIGQTPNVTVRIATALGAVGKDLALGCLRHVEDDFQHVSKLFGITLPAADLILTPLSFDHNGSGGSYHYGCLGTDLYCDVQFGNIWTSLGLFVAELTEVAEGVQDLGWDCSASNGEGLSRVIAQAIHPTVLDGYTTAGSWLDGPRANFVDTNNNTDQDRNANGCSVLFLNWLWKMWGFSFTQICRAGGDTLAETYLNLTGKGTAWADFVTAVESRWPAGTPSGVRKDQAW